jgi:hypothetical protein
MDTHVLTVLFHELGPGTKYSEAEATIWRRSVLLTNEIINSKKHVLSWDVYKSSNGLFLMEPQGTKPPLILSSDEII